MESNNDGSFSFSLEDKQPIDNKYYIPNIEDLFIGYECELKLLNWSKYIFNNVNSFKIFDIDIKDILNKTTGLITPPIIRTKYLDKKDIEECEWKFFPKLSADHLRFVKDDYVLFLEDEILTILKLGVPYGTSTIFNGECKSINELKKIMKWLHI